MIDALIKLISVTYKCYEMYAHQGKKVQLLDVLRSIKKWMSSYKLSALLTEFAESSFDLVLM